MNDWIAPIVRPRAAPQSLATQNALAVGGIAYISRRQALEDRWHYIVGKLAEFKRAHPGVGFPREWTNEKDSLDNQLALMPLDEKHRVMDTKINPAAINAPPMPNKTPLDRFRAIAARLVLEGGTVRDLIEAIDLCAKAMPEPRPDKPFGIPNDIVIDADDGHPSLTEIRAQLEDQK